VNKDCGDFLPQMRADQGGQRRFGYGATSAATASMGRALPFAVKDGRIAKMRITED